MLESKFQKHVIDRLKDTFIGCIVIKNDPTYIQGFPDLLVIYEDQWAALECKNSSKAKHQPNQEYYVTKLDGMGFADFIYPENEDYIFRELESYFLL